MTVSEQTPSSVWLLTVARTARPSSSFVRITLSTEDPRFAQTFQALGNDQWFRLFMPIDGVLELPYGDADGWYSRWLEMDEKVRGVIRTAFMEGVTYDSLATRENVPLGTMKSWIRRGLLRLRSCLES